LEAFKKAAQYQNFSALVVVAGQYYNKLFQLASSERIEQDKLIKTIEKHWKDAQIHGIPAFLENAKAYLCIAAVKDSAAEREGAWLNALKYLYAAKMCEEKLALSQEQEEAAQSDLQKRIQEQLAASKYNAYWGLSLEEYYSCVARKYKEISKD